MDDAAIAWLNARLPKKRAIGQALLRNLDGRVLLCELTYKAAWDLPGGVLEPDESPRRGALREVREELGIDLPAVRLLAVNWMSSWRGWDDACTFLFDGGTHATDLLDRLTLQRRELVAAHWCTPDEVRSRAAAATARLLDTIGASDGDGPWYLEDGAH